MSEFLNEKDAQEYLSKLEKAKEYLGDDIKCLKPGTIKIERQYLKNVCDGCDGLGDVSFAYGTYSTCTKCKGEGKLLYTRVSIEYINDEQQMNLFVRVKYEPYNKYKVILTNEIVEMELKIDK